jgi:hypothetical protein
VPKTRLVNNSLRVTLTPEEVVKRGFSSGLASLHLAMQSDGGLELSLSCYNFPPSELASAVHVSTLLVPISAESSVFRTVLTGKRGGKRVSSSSEGEPSSIGKRTRSGEKSGKSGRTKKKPGSTRSGTGSR